MKDWQKTIDRYYPAGDPLRDIYITHCRQVADLALSINASRQLGLDPAQVEAAAMLHDIGIFLTSAESIMCRGDKPYIAHGVEGAALLRRDGWAEEIARVAERHTGSGLTADEIVAQGLPIEPRDLLPETTLERLVCYADKFFSKSGDMKRKPFGRVRASMERHGAAALERFDALVSEFGALD